MHYWSAELTREASTEEVVDASRGPSRIAPIRMDQGLTAINAVKQIVPDLSRWRADLHGVALWGDLLTVRSDDASYAYMVDNQATVISRDVDAIRALSNWEFASRSRGPIERSASTQSSVDWRQRARAGLAMRKPRISAEGFPVHCPG